MRVEKPSAFGFLVRRCRGGCADVFRAERLMCAHNAVTNYHPPAVSLNASRRLVISRSIACASGTCNSA